VLTADLIWATASIVGLTALLVSQIAFDAIRVAEAGCLIYLGVRISGHEVQIQAGPYPKDNEPRTMALPNDLLDQLATWISERDLRTGDLLFATREGTPISRNTFSTRVRPAGGATSHQS